MSRRTVLLALALNLAFATTHAWAQQANKVPIVGILQFGIGPAPLVYETFRQELRELGYVEGHNIKIEFRTAQGQPDRLPGAAEELVRLKVDVIVAMNTQTAQAVKRATSTIPIVISLVADPVGSGLVANLAHPGGNVTGLSLMSNELSAKRLQLLKEAMPRVARIAVLWNPSSPHHAKVIEELKAAAPSLSLELSFLAAQVPDELDAAFSALSRTQAQALYLIDSPFSYVHRMTLAKLASKARLPSIYGARDYTDAGGLMSYGANYADQIRRTAVYVDKIVGWI